MSNPLLLHCVDGVIQIVIQSCYENLLGHDIHDVLSVYKISTGHEALSHYVSLNNNSNQLVLVIADRECTLLCSINF